jgi:hypothetical protein
MGALAHGFPKNLFLLEFQKMEPECTLMCRASGKRVRVAACGVSPAWGSREVMDPDVPQMAALEALDAVPLGTVQAPPALAEAPPLTLHNQALALPGWILETPFGQGAFLHLQQHDDHQVQGSGSCAMLAPVILRRLLAIAEEGEGANLGDFLTAMEVHLESQFRRNPTTGLFDRMPPDIPAGQLLGLIRPHPMFDKSDMLSVASRLRIEGGILPFVPGNVFTPADDPIRIVTRAEYAAALATLNPLTDFHSMAVLGTARLAGCHAATHVVALHSWGETVDGRRRVAAYLPLYTMEDAAEDRIQMALVVEQTFASLFYTRAPGKALPAEPRLPTGAVVAQCIPAFPRMIPAPPVGPRVRGSS